MALRAPHDDAVGRSSTTWTYEVGVGLLVRRLRAVALHVGLRDRDREVVVAAVLVEGLTPLARLALEHRSQAEQRVGADSFSEISVPPSAVIVSISRMRASRSSVVWGIGSTRVFVAGVGILRHREVAIRRVVPDLEVERGVVDRDTQVGLLEDVVDPLPAVPEGATVAERRAVLVGGRRPIGHSRRRS